MSADPFLNTDDGRKLYVVTRSEWGIKSEYLVAAESLAEAKREHGWTRQRFVSLEVRRARQSNADLPRRDR